MKQNVLHIASQSYAALLAAIGPMKKDPKTGFCTKEIDFFQQQKY
jgi:hypothetical protein